MIHVNGTMALTPTVGAALPGDEKDLVLQAQSGDADAREELAVSHRRSAYLLALQMTGNPDDALDVAQDAMLKFFSTLGRFDPTRPVKPWLLTIVRNQVRDLWRRRKIRVAESLDAEEDGLSREIVDPAANPERDASRSELRARIWRALAKLEPAKREILVLRDYHDLTYNEISEVSSIPLGTVMSRLHRARRELAELLRAMDGPEARKSGGGDA